jgi:hypothetical protein
MKWPKLLIIFTAIIHTACLCGQFYSTGESPASIKWDQINTANFRIVYPRGLVEDANQIAQKMEYYLPLSMGDLTHPIKKKCQILVNNSSVLSNGYVTLAPSRMELVITPPQDAYAQDWISQLVLHEFRHVAQLNRLNQGFTKVFSWVTGDIVPGIVASQMQSWFYEGDAVYNETRLSQSGRGRVPGFAMPLRTILLERDKKYNYNKAIFGSYRHAVPDHYVYGYQMVEYARSKYGSECWPEAINYTSRHPYYIWPLAFYLKKNYGMYKSGLYRKTIDSLKQQYNSENRILNSKKYLNINARTNSVFTNYLLPKDMGNGNILALRSGLNDPGSFVMIDTSGRITKLFSTGRSKKLKCDVYENRLIWDEIAADPRWEGKSYSEIMVADLNKGSRRTLTKKSRYFSPDFSPDGNWIAVTETDIHNRNFVSILDAHTGKCLRQISTPENKAVQLPEWTDYQHIAVVTVADKGKQLEMLNLVDESWSVLIPYTGVDISEPLNYHKYILFRGSFNGIEDIYAISKTDSTALYQVTFSSYGAYHPSLSRNSTNLLFSDYSVDGFNISTTPLDSSNWGKVSPNCLLSSSRESLLQNKTPNWKTISGNSGKAEPYRKGSHLFNIHSWVPFYTDIDELTDSPKDLPITPGFMLFSQNLLSTFISSIGYSYDQGFHKFIPSITWRGWYPVFELSGQLGGPALRLQVPEGVILPDNPGPYNEVTLKTYIPLIYDRQAYIIQVQPRIEFQRLGIWYYSGKAMLNGIDFFHLKANINRYRRFSTRDLYPSWGQFLSVSYTQTPIERGQYGDLFSIEAISFFPGIAAQHHFFINGGYQVQHVKNYFIPINRIEFPRGYSATVSEQFTSLLFNYSFAAGYPDWSLGPLLYLKRFRVNLFYDWSYGVNVREYIRSGITYYTGEYSSYGTEILADMHLLRFIFPISAGVRVGYIPNKGKLFSEMMLSVNTGVF